MSESSGTAPGRRPVEAKVKAATAGAGAATAVGGALVWALDTYWWTPGVSGDVPAPVGTLVMVVAAGAVAWCAGWLARHTHRPDLETAP